MWQSIFGILTEILLMSGGLKEGCYRVKAFNAALNAPVRTVKYDDRMTAVETEYREHYFRIDAFEVFEKILPDMC